MTADAHLTWTKGGHASFLAAQDDAVTLRSTIPSPPGSRLDGTLLARGEHPDVAIRIKIHGSKKETDGSFTLRGRLVDFTRATRERIHALASSTPSPEPPERGIA